MALFDRILPAWRHRDPEVRADAVRELGRDARDVLASIARNDTDARVRRLAIKKLDDTEALLEIGRTDPDEELRALATARAEELLVERAMSPDPLQDCERALAALTRPSQRMTVALRAFHPAVRRAALSSVSDQRPLADIARRSDDTAIGLAALERVTEAALLRRIAGDAPSEVALAALARIDEPELLLAIADDPQSQKAVRKQARGILDRLLTDDHPIRVAQRREGLTQVCVAVERLVHESDPAAARAALHQAENDWRDLTTGAAPEPGLAARYRDASATAIAAIARLEDRSVGDERRAAARVGAYAAREHLCETIDALEGPDTPARLDAARAEWQALEPSDDPRGAELASRFAAAVERCEQRHQRWRAREAFRSRLDALVRDAERLVDAGDPRAATKPRAALEQRWAQLASSPEGTKWLADERVLQRRFTEAGDALRRQAETAKSERQQREREAAAQLKGLCDRLERLGKADAFKHATAQRALHAATEALRHFPPVPVSERETLRQRLTAAEHTLAQRIGQQEVAEDWKRWANADVQQQLIERADALLAGGDPAQILRQTGELEREWTRVAVAPRDQSQALWERFRTARNELRRRSTAYLAENLAKKEALCAAIEPLADSTDWNATADAIRQMQTEWKQIGPVRKQVSTALFERFRTPANKFFERRKEFLLANKERREAILGRMRALCEAAEAVAESTDWDATAAEIKRLQGEAHTLWRPRRGPTPPRAEGPRQSDILRDRFKDACDRFFERYRHRDELRHDAALAAAETILANLAALHESLTGPDAPTPEQVTHTLKDRLAEWGQIGTIAPDRMRALRLRLQARCDAIEAAYADGLSDETLAPESHLEQREKLCTKLERLVASLTASGGEPSAGDLAERLKLALAANTIGGSAATQREQELRDAADAAERLREKWLRLGPVVGPRARTLAHRFEQAAAELNALRRRSRETPS